MAVNEAVDYITADTRGSLQYEPLDATLSEIRLVRVSDLVNDLYLGLETKTVRLEDVDDQYIAISYVWGAELPAHRVYVNGQILLIRRNIWKFLVHSQLALNIADNWLWIDSICINQNDVPEKNHQVAMMGKIFGCAREVFVWLGPYDGVKPLEDRYVEVNKHENYISAATMGSGPDLAQAWEASGLPDVLWEMLDFAMTNLYWTRLWIIQELRLARKPYIIFAQFLVPFQVFADLHSPWQQATMPFRTTLGQSTQQRAIDDNIQATLNAPESEPYTRSLLHLIYRHKKSRCQDRRDKIFGLLALADLAEPFDVDYSISRQELFARTLLYASKDSDRWTEITNPEKVFAMVLNIIHIETLMDVLDVTAQDLKGYTAATNDPTSELSRQQVRLELEFAAAVCVVLSGTPSAASKGFPVHVVDMATRLTHTFDSRAGRPEIEGEVADGKEQTLWLSCGVKTPRFIPSIRLMLCGNDQQELQIAFVYEVKREVKERFELKALFREQIPEIVSEEILAGLRMHGTRFEHFEGQTLNIFCSPLCMAYMADMEHSRAGHRPAYPRPGRRHKMDKWSSTPASDQ